MSFNALQADTHLALIMGLFTAVTSLTALAAIYGCYWSRRRKKDEDEDSTDGRVKFRANKVSRTEENQLQQQQQLPLLRRDDVKQLKKHAAVSFKPWHRGILAARTARYVPTQHQVCPT